MEHRKDGLFLQGLIHITSPYLGEVTLRSDIYRIVARSISNNDFGYTLCSDCLYRKNKEMGWRRYRQTLWARDNLVCGECGAMNQPTFERLSLDKKKRLDRKAKTSGKAK